MSLTARMTYEVEVTSEDEAVVTSRIRIRAVLEAAGVDGLSPREIGDAVAADGRGPGLHKTTIGRTLAEMLADGEIDGTKGDHGRPGRW